MITINLDKAKTIVHDLRRTKRTAEFAPLDIKATIPFEAAAAEAERQTIREKYTALQIEIDAATAIAELKTIVDTI